MESTDQKILALLAADGRISYTDIGRETGLSTSAAQQRVRRLEQRGIISGYRAVVNPETLGRTLTAFISIRPLVPEQDEEVPGLLDAMPEILSCFSVAGDASYLIEAQVGTPAELDALLTRIRMTANVTTQTTIVLTTIFRDRQVLEPSGE
ncbi:Lrp/AsnC family transcriptional regulator [Luteococcus sediminum]|uniref:Lrp/AsnC family transcriptional regulator n=1 Tax=Luteococcus sp. TaxID=1969402 RepID=UPI003734DE9D